jgi:hypothetical protein
MASITNIAITDPTTDGYITAAQTVEFTLTFSAAVTLTGGVRLALNTGPIRYATYQSGSGTNSLVFLYTATAEDTSAGPIFVVGVDLNSGTLKAGSDDVDLTIYGEGGVLVPTVSGPAGVVVNAVTPEFSYIGMNKEYAKPGDVLDFIVSGSDVVGDIASTGCTVVETDGTTHTLRYTIVDGDTEQVGRDFTVTGTNDAGTAGSTTITVPIKVIKSASTPIPSKPDGSESVTSAGILIFDWDAATHPLYGAGGISGYEATFKQGAAVVGTQIVPAELTHASYSVTGGGASGTQYTCSVKAINAVGDLSEASDSSDPITVDTRRPKALITSSTTAGAKINSEFAVTLSFVDPDTNDGMAMAAVPLDAITVVNGTRGEFTPGGTGVYTLAIKPVNRGLVSVKMSAGNCVAANGSTNTASNIFSVDYNSTRPACTLSKPPSRVCESPITIPVTFSGPVSGLTADSVTVTGGTAVVETSTAPETSKWTISVTPSGAGAITVVVDDEAATDAYGNTSRTSNLVTTNYDNSQPEVSAVSVLEPTHQHDILSVKDAVDFRVTFNPDRPLKVSVTDGVPYLEITVGAAERRAAYISGSGSNALVFRYVVAHDEVDGKLGNGDIVASAGAIRDMFGNEADLTIGTDFVDAIDLNVDMSQPPVASSGRSISDAIASSVAEDYVSNTRLAESVILSGVGGGEDLLVSIAAAANDSWVPRIRKGWCYYQDTEHYLFAKKMQVVSSNHTSATPITLSTTNCDIGYDHTKVLSYGPVIVTSVSDVLHPTTPKPFVQVAGNLRACFSSTGSSVTGTNRYEHVLAGFPVEVYRTSMSSQMRRVPTPEAVQDSNEYCAEMELSGETLQYKVTVSGPSDIYVTMVVDPWSSDSVVDWFRQEEIAVVDQTMKLRTMYKEIIPVAVGSYTAPSIKLLEDGVYTSVTATGFLDSDVIGSSGNVLNLPDSYTRSDTQTGTIKPGDRVVISYYVNHSWVINENVLHALDVCGAPVAVTVNYEGSIADTWDGDDTPRTSGSFVQLNPLKDGVNSGFLYIVDEDTVSRKVSRLDAYVSPGNTTVGATDSEPVRVVVMAVDANGDPVRDAKITVSTAGAAGSFVKGCTFPESAMTDWRGLVRYVWKPSAAGDATLTFSTGGVSAVATVHQHSYADLIDSAFDAATTNKKMYMILTDQPDRPGTMLARAYVTDITGSFPVYGVSVLFKSQNGAFADSTAIVTNRDGIASNTYKLSGSDLVWAESGGVVSSRIRIGEG